MGTGAHQSVSSRTGVTLWVDPADGRGQALVAAAGDVNPVAMGIWQRLVAGAPWDLVVDVGANYGEMLFGAPLPPRAAVVAFEPNPSVLPHLRRTLDGAQAGVTLVEQALGERCGTSTFAVDDAWSGTSRLADEGDHLVDVEMTTLDQALAALGLAGRRRVLVKIDVEGAELAVLAGAAATVASADDVVCLLEVAHDDPEQVAELSRDWCLYLWELSFGRLVRVPPGTAEQVARFVSSAGCYPHDVVVSRRPLYQLPLPGVRDGGYRGDGAWESVEGLVEVVEGHGAARRQLQARIDDLDAQLAVARERAAVTDGPPAAHPGWSARFRRR